MICDTTSHFQYHRVLLLVLGLWPYKQSKLVQLQLTFIFMILVSFIVSQLSVFVSNAECTMNVVIKVLSVALFIIIFTINFSSFRIYTHVLKECLDDLQYICNKLQDENEIAIIEKYGNDSKRITAIATSFLLFTIIGCMLASILSYIPGIVFINEMALRRIIRTFMPVYYFDDEKYFYLLLLHFNAVAQIGGTTMVATGMIFLSILQHACAMFKIASYRIEKALIVNIMKNGSLRNEINCKEIILAVDIHRRAVKFCEILNTGFHKVHTALMMTSVICLSLNLYRVTEITSFGNDFELVLIPVVIIITLFVYFFLANYAGQELTDHHDSVFTTAYNIRWYLAPLHVQKLVLLLLQRGSRTLILHLGGIFALSLEFFAMLMKLSVSYFTIVRSMQQ